MVAILRFKTEKSGAPSRGVSKTYEKECKKSAVTQRDNLDFGLQLLETMSKLSDAVTEQVTGSAFPSSWTSQSLAFGPAQRTVLIEDELAAPERSEVIAKEHVNTVLERLGIKPEKATRCQIYKALSILRAQFPMPLLPV